MSLGTPVPLPSVEPELELLFLRILKPKPLSNLTPGGNEHSFSCMQSSLASLP